ncbi:MAG: sigma-70 family RNA polymerase sigma factor [Pirellulales bacterium]
MQAIETPTELSSAPVGELVGLARAGDRGAFDQLVRRFEGAVYATALRRLGNHAEAQELCQDVFLQALRKLDQLNAPEAFGGWLRSIAVRMSINRQIRKAPLVTAEPETFDSHCVDHRTPLVQALDNERSAQVRAGLTRLRELDRQTLVAFYVHGQTLREMSDSFDSPVGTIKRRLHVARKRLARELEAVVAV